MTNERIISRMQYDNIEQMIIDDGFLYNETLNKKSMTSQFLRACMYKGTDFKTSFMYYLENAKPYEYMWQVLHDEINAMAHIKQKEEFLTRKRFFNRYIAQKICKDSLYMYDNDKYAKLYLKKAMSAHSYKDTAFFLEKIKTKAKGRHVPKHRLWINAYTGLGLYNTFKWLIKYDNCRFSTAEHTEMNVYESLAYLEELIDSAKNDYSKLFPVLEKLLADNKSTEAGGLYESFIQSRCNNEVQEACE